MRKSLRCANDAAKRLPSSVGELNAISSNDKNAPNKKWLRIDVIILAAIPWRRYCGATQIREIPHLKW